MMLSSCNPSRHLPDGQYLLNRNKVRVTNPTREVSASDLEGLIKQSPNRRLLGLFPLRLGLFNTFRKGWIHRQLGEAPAIYDPALTRESEDNMKRYLEKIGFFGSEVNVRVKGIPSPDEATASRKRNIRKVTYEVTLSEPYRIREVHNQVDDEILRGLVESWMPGSPVRPGEIFNSYVLDEERNRLAAYLLDLGYYAFSESYVFFEIDSTVGNRQLDIRYRIRNPLVPSAGSPDSLVDGRHRSYLVRDIYIHPDYKIQQRDTALFDTLVEVVYPLHRDEPNRFHFIFTPPLKIQPRIITQSTFIEPNRVYRLSNVKKTLRRLRGLRMYRYVDIRFQEVPEPKKPDESRLDCRIFLTRAPVQSYSIEVQGTNSGGDLGLSGYLVYQNKNIFRGAETFRARIKGGLEAQKFTTTSPEEYPTQLPFFNTYETGVEFSLFFPKFLLPVKQERFSKSYEPTTSLNLNYNYQVRQDYKRLITNPSLGYEWQESRFKKHLVFPFDLSLIKVLPTPEFDSILGTVSDPRIKNQYMDHLIAAMRYSFIFNNQEISKVKNFIYFRGNFETSGALLNTMQRLGGIPLNDQGHRTLLEIRYSQYIRPDIDFRYYFMPGKDQTVVWRTAVGVAIPYGNSESIPFEKGYFAGGANGMRGWPLRSLGPGSFSKTDLSIERVGDIQIEGNLEYRFPFYSVVNGALFLDAGNVWLMNPSTTFPGGQFMFDLFFKEFAVDGGLGLRLDFKFFIVRLDIAHRLRDPSYPPEDRWMLDEISPRTLTWNLGIGYPF